MPNRYRPPSTPPKGAWARHIHAVRQERGWSQTEGFRKVRVALGLSENSRSAYLPIDLGERQPDADEAEALAKVYGWPPSLDPENPQPTPEEQAPPPDPSALVEALNRQTAALERQTAAIDALVVQLARVAEGQVGMGSALAQIAGLALGSPALPGTPTEPPSPPVNGGSGGKGHPRQ